MKRGRDREMKRRDEGRERWREGEMEGGREGGRARRRKSVVLTLDFLLLNRNENILFFFFTLSNGSAIFLLPVIC